ncbi:MAG: hypothetical protein GF311_02255 [Candidatus Lokiarchaeota archaeon]|nr:hypothetical protein [Candidatus Lokiarchaeota archaeon]
MDKEPEYRFSKSNIDIAKLIEQFRNENPLDFTKDDVKDLLSQLDVDTGLSDMAQDSVKNLFDLGFEAFNNLNLEVILDMFEKGSEKQKKEEENPKSE